MIRSSEINGRQPTREVTAQRYQAAVQPAPLQVSGVEKLLDFGMKAAQTKFQWDKEEFQAKMTLTNDKVEKNIKAMKPADYAKDPEAAWKAAGGEDYDAILADAPPGTQKVMRPQIDAMKAQTEASMKAADKAQVHMQAVVVNTKNYLDKNGTLTPEMMGNISNLSEENQTIAWNAAAQTARTNRSLKMFDDAIADPRTQPKDVDMLIRVRRETEKDIIAEQRYQQRMARQRQKDLQQAQKDAEEAGSLNSAANAVLNNNEHPERAALYYGVPLSKIMKKVYNTPGGMNKVLATGYVPPQMTSSMKDGLKNLRAADGSIPTSYIQASNDELTLIMHNDGNVNALNGGHLDDNSTVIAAMTYDAFIREQQKPNPKDRRSYAEIRNSIDRTVPSSATAKPANSAQRDEVDEATSVLNSSQKDQFMNIYGGVKMREGSHEQAIEIALKTVQEGTQTTGQGYVINDVHVLRNKLTKQFGHLVDDEDGVNKIINNGVDAAIITYAQALMKNDPTKQISTDPAMWKQFGSADGELYFTYLGEPLDPLVVGEKAIKLTAGHLEKNDPTIGQTREVGRGENSEAFDWSTGYPIQKVGGQ